LTTGICREFKFRLKEKRNSNAVSAGMLRRACIKEKSTEEAGRIRMVSRPQLTRGAGTLRVIELKILLHPAQSIKPYTNHIEEIKEAFTQSQTSHRRIRNEPQ
jgi:hypothetical protein